jgi:uncharacterized membrane protein YhaH (DUF805 family)
MDFMTAVKFCLNNYFTIEGRAQRSQYWWFYLFVLIIIFVASMIDAITGLPVFGLIAMLAILAPYICVAIRRMHDKDKSGWWLLISFVPVIGFFYLLYLFVTRGTEGENRFGPDPLA